MNKPYTHAPSSGFLSTRFFMTFSIRKRLSLDKPYSVTLSFTLPPPYPPAHLEVELDLIYSNGILPRVVLQHSRKERLREVKARQPEVNRSPISDPIREELQPRLQIQDISTKRLQRRIRFLHPNLRDLSIHDLLASSLQTLTQQDLPCNIQRHISHTTLQLHPLTL